MIWWIAAGILTYISVPIFLPIFQGSLKHNYLNEAIPTGLGLVFVLTGALVSVARSGRERYAAPFVFVLLFFSILGLLDDAYGEQSRKGFRGHLASRNLTTGALKAWGGMAISLAVVSPMSSNWFQFALNGVIIALMANFFNLLDVRPGRAGKAFLILGLVLFLVEPKSLGPLFGMLCAAGGFLPWDLRRVVMMGDSGSNPLGAVLGLGCVLVLPLAVRIGAALILLVLNLLSERVSFSEVIESNRFLRYLDQLGR